MQTYSARALTAAAGLDTISCGLSRVPAGSAMGTSGVYQDDAPATSAQGLAEARDPLYLEDSSSSVMSLYHAPLGRPPGIWTSRRAGDPRPVAMQPASLAFRRSGSTDSVRAQIEDAQTSPACHRSFSDRRHLDQTQEIGLATPARADQADALARLSELFGAGGQPDRPISAALVVLTNSRRVHGALAYSRTCPSCRSRARKREYGTSWTATPASMAIAAAVAAECPRIMNTGSIRIDPKAMCVLETHTGTSRLSACPRFGTSAP